MSIVWVEFVSGGESEGVDEPEKIVQGQQIYLNGKLFGLVWNENL